MPLIATFVPSEFVYGFAYTFVSLAEREEGWDVSLGYGADPSPLVEDLRNAASRAMSARLAEPCVQFPHRDYRLD